MKSDWQDIIQALTFIACTGLIFAVLIIGSIKVADSLGLDPSRPRNAVTITNCPEGTP